MDVSLTTPQIGALERIGEATSRAPDQVAHDWIVERLIHVGAPDAKRSAKDPIDSSLTTENERLRERYRPSDVVFLLVGESAPAGGTFFYRADSNLFHATREAFVRGLGAMPEGEAFFERFKELGFWLYDLAPNPVNRTPGRPRKDAVSAGVGALATLLRDVEPDMIIGVKTSLEGPIKAAAAMADVPAYRTMILPFPLYQWREEYIGGMRRFLSGSPKAGMAPEASPSESRNLTLHEAMRRVLESAPDQTLAARQIANEVATQRLYERQDGSRADYQQILLRARKYPQLFEVKPGGVSLRVPPADG